MRIVIVFFSLVLFLNSCTEDTPPQVVFDTFQLTALRVGTTNILSSGAGAVPFDKPIVCSFSKSLDTTTVMASISISPKQGADLGFSLSYLDDEKTISILPKNIDRNTTYQITIQNTLRAADGSTFPGYSQSFITDNLPLTVVSAVIDGQGVSSARITEVSLNPEITVTFSDPVSVADVADYVSIVKPSVRIVPTIRQENENTLVFNVEEQLDGYERFRFRITSNVSVDDRPFDEFNFEFFTALDSTLKFPEIPDDELLTLVQEQTFKYFYDFGHPNSGLARERNTSGNTVTIGGSGFGLMALIVGIERGFISRVDGISRIEKIINFLMNDADRFHGAWSHWLDGNTGTVIPFSANDDGADLVETAFMVQAMITVRQYLDETNPQELAIINNINTMYSEVEWDWFQQEGDSWLTWHWSPNFGFEIDLPIRGWDEALIIYVLAASSPTHTIDPSVYTDGWARSGGIVNGNQYYDITLPLGVELGGPLFFSHYSFLGLDPRNLSDQYADYWEQNVAHSLINRAYCIDNPRNFLGYGANSWGLTASDNHQGYSAHSPTNDLGVITPTAAISSIPYTPDESMDAIRHFYYLLGDKLWGPYGFYDAFNVTEGWYATSYLAIDQGPIVCMIENYRTGLLWNLFMSAPEVQASLDKLGFNY